MKTSDLDLASRYFDGELDQAEKEAFEKRLLSEDHLRGLLEELKGLDISARELEVYKAPEIKFPRIMGARYGHIRSRIGPFLAGVAAAACVLVGIGMGTGIFKTPSQELRTEAFRIVYYAPGADSVSIVGDFNDWSNEIPLMRRDKGGYWIADFRLKPGEYRYVLLVDGEERAGDPMADYVIDDDFGSKNSVVRIGL